MKQHFSLNEKAKWNWLTDDERVLIMRYVTRLTETELSAQKSVLNIDKYNQKSDMEKDLIVWLARADQLRQAIKNQTLYETATPTARDMFDRAMKAFAEGRMIEIKKERERQKRRGRYRY